MKIFYLLGAVFFSIIILILSFENIAGFCYELQFFFYKIDSKLPPTILFFGVAFLGMITGAFYYGFILELFKGSPDDEDSEGDDF